MNRRMLLGEISVICHQFYSIVHIGTKICTGDCIKYKTYNIVVGRIKKDRTQSGRIKVN
jgi:hypothetical protein